MNISRLYNTCLTGTNTIFTPGHLHELIFSFWLSSLDKLISHQNVNSSRCNPRPSQDAGQPASIGEVVESICKSSLMLCNRLHMEISKGDCTIPVWKLLSKRLKKHLQVKKIEDRMINVMGMTFLMGRHLSLPLTLPVVCMFFLPSVSTVGSGIIIYTAFTNIRSWKKSPKGLWQYEIAVWKWNRTDRKIIS